MGRVESMLGRAIGQAEDSRTATDGAIRSQIERRSGGSRGRRGRASGSIVGQRGRDVFPGLPQLLAGFFSRHDLALAEKLLGAIEVIVPDGHRPDQLSVNPEVIVRIVKEAARAVIVAQEGILDAAIKIERNVASVGPIRPDDASHLRNPR
jgi:hypothetical protein